MNNILYFSQSLINILTSFLSEIGNIDSILLAPFVILFLYGVVYIAKGILSSV